LWNAADQEAYWRKTSGGKLQPRWQAGAGADKVLQFLHVRTDAKGQSVLRKLGRPIEQGDNWYRLQWLELKQETAAQLREDGWEKAWHGSKLEGLYSIVCCGRLAESRSEANGERMSQGLPGVYCMKDSRRAQAEGYARFVHLFRDGVLWCATFELLVKRNMWGVKQTMRDQWVQRLD